MPDPAARTLRADLGKPLTRAALLTGGAVVGLVLVTGVAGAVLTTGDVPRGTHVGTVDVGGLSDAEARAALERAFTAAAAEPLPVVAAGKPGTLDLTGAGLTLDADATLAQVESPRFGPWGRLWARLSPETVDPVLVADEGALAGALAPLQAEVDRPMVDGAVGFDDDGVSPTEPVPGMTLQVQDVPAAVAAVLLGGERPVPLPVATTEPTVSAETVADTAAGPATLAVAAGITLTVTDTGREDVEVAVPASAVAAALTFVPDGEGGLEQELDPDALHSAVSAELASVEDPAVDATFRFVGGVPTVVPSQDGRAVAPEDLAAAVRGVLGDVAPRTATAALTPAEPRVSTETARGLNVVERISTFTTRHPCCAPRVTNIHTIADLLDGYVVLPGETFSLNTVVGARDTRRGFVGAPMINRGRFEESVGGGISQFATTMFNAVFFAGLEDVQHKPHSFYISRYPAGRESTVSFPEPDFRWRNDSPDGVLVDTSYTGTSITVTFWGTKRFDAVRSESGPRTRVTPFTSGFDASPDCIPMPGAEGFDIEVTRVFVKQGEPDRREVFSTRYLPEPRITCGTEPAPAPSPEPSPSPSPAASPAPAPASPAPAPAPPPASPQPPPAG